MSSVFTKIINREIPAYIIAENEDCIAFLDAFPVMEGHVLVVPKSEVDKIYELPEDKYAALMLFARKVAQAVEKTIPCTRVGISVVGLEVHHAHVHLLPLNGPQDMNLGAATLSPPKEKMQEIAAQIASHIKK